MRRRRLGEVGAVGAAAGEDEGRLGAGGRWGRVGVGPVEGLAGRDQVGGGGRCGRRGVRADRILGCEGLEERAAAAIRKVTVRVGPSQDTGTRCNTAV